MNDSTLGHYRVALAGASGSLECEMHLLQCCNVGDVLGGTAACAWSLARALPGCRHTVVFFGAVTDETRRAFGEWEVLELGRLEARVVRRLAADAVVLHNAPEWRVLGALPAVTLVYLHSHFRGAYVGDATAYCSRWLARRYGADEGLVLYQGVEGVGGAKPQPPERGSGLVVGRLCTPQARKWPTGVVEFYAELARQLPGVRWEFVGCPVEWRGRLAEACRGRARFFEASREARGRLREWDVWCYSNPGLIESFGRVCAEAMLAGCVPVVDRLGGFCEQVEDGVSGCLCGSVDEFAAALERLQNRAILKRMGAAARERAQRLFSLRALGDRVLVWLEAAARAGLNPQRADRGLRSGASHSAERARLESTGLQDPIVAQVG